MRRVALLMFLVPLAVAGTPDDPEIRDDPGDADWEPYPVPDTGQDDPSEHAGAFDILATWFHNETPESIRITMKVVSLENVDDFTGATNFARWGTRFELSNYVPDTRENWWNYTWIAGINFNNGPSGWQGSLLHPDAFGERGERVLIDFNVDREANELMVTIPRSELGNPSAGDRMFDTLSLHDGTWNGFDFKDQSPDGSYPSRDYVFTMDSASNVTAPIAAPPTVNTTAPSPPNATTDTEGPDKESPSPALLLPLLLALWRRR